jgi:uncharacterized protein YegL
MASALHAYLLLDSSASMDGAPLEALKQGLQLLCGTFISRSKRPVKISMITFESTAREIASLRDVTEFDLPRLEAAGSSGLGGAFRLVSEVMPDHDPSLVYVFTDGEPTDDWEAAIEALRPRVKTVVGIACGPVASTAALEPVLDRVFQMRDLMPDLLFDTFRSFV